MSSLNDAPPPEDRAVGHKPDPLGSGNERFWDGSKWTTQTRTVKGKSGGGMSTPVKVIVGLLILGVIIAAIADSGGKDEDPSPAAPTKTSTSGKVDFSILKSKVGVPDPYGENDPTFNENHTIVSVTYRLKNGTKDRVAPDFYLSGNGGYTVNGVSAAGEFGIDTIDSGKTLEGEVLFGYLTMELPPVRLKVNDVQGGEILFNGAFP